MNIHHITFKLIENHGVNENFLSRLPLGLAFLSPKLDSFEVNAAFCQLLDYSNPEILAQEIKKIIYPEDDFKGQLYFEQLLKAEINTYQNEVKYNHLNGKTLWLRVNFSYTSDSAGTLEKIIILIDDFTVAKKIEERLEMKSREMEQFAYIASHDLQEPLRAISSYLELLDESLRTRKTEKEEKLLKKSLDSASRMENLIKDLLLYSRSDKIKTIETVDCNQVVSNVRENLEQLIKETNSSIYSDNLPVIRADYLRIEQLFQNLLSNSIKYRKPDLAPIIRITAKKEQTFWIFSFSDNGIGIDSEYHDLIFDIFRKLHSSREYPGSGLGLAICRKIVEFFGGKIKVDSKEGEGSTFNIFLPLEYF